MLALVVGAVLAFNAGTFQARIEAEMRASSGAHVELGRVYLEPRWPLTFTVGTTLIDHGLAIVTWQRLDVEVLKFTAPYFLNVRIFKPKVTVKLDAAATASAPARAGSVPGSRPAAAPPLGLRLAVADGEILTPQGGIRGLELRFEQARLLTAAVAKLHLKAGIKANLFPIELPVTIDSNSLTLSRESVKAKDLDVTVAGLKASLQGTSLLKDSRHRWLLALAADDLAKLPPPPAQVPIKELRGAVRVKTEVIKDSAASPWQIQGTVIAEKFKGVAMVNQEGLTVEGPVAVDASVQFGYIDSRPLVERMTVDADLSAARVAYKDMLAKAAGVPLKAHVAGRGDAEKLFLEALGVELWNFKAKVSGTTETATPWNANLAFAVEPADLAGAENVFPPLRASPVKGRLALTGTIQGELADPVKAHIQLSDLRLKGFAATIDYDKPGVLQARGPITADIQGKGEWRNQMVTAADGQGLLGFSGPAMVVGPLRKEAGRKLDAVFKARNAGAKVIFDRLDVETFFGTVTAQGQVEEPLNPKLDLVVEAKNVSLSELRVAMPAQRESIPKGLFNARLRLNGRIDTSKPWSDWPLTTTGHANVVLPEYVLPDEVSAPRPQPGAAAGPPAVETGFLPKGALLSRLNVAVSAAIKQLRKPPDLVVDGIAVDGRIATTRFAGKVEIAKIFDGKVELNQMVVPLVDPKPVIQGAANWVDIDIEKAMAFAKPVYKEMARGKTMGTATFTTRLPSEPDFLKTLKTKGRAQAKPVTLNTVKFGEMINAYIAKIPAVKLNPVKTDPLRGEMNADFDLGAGVLNLPSIRGLDTNGSEIDMKGNLRLEDMHADLVGTLYLVDAQMKGCVFEANADAKGRLVVPLAIKGDMMNPGMSLISDMVGKIAGRALECEKRKLIDKIKSDGKEKLEKKLKDSLKGILGN